MDGLQILSLPEGAMNWQPNPVVTRFYEVRGRAMHATLYMGCNLASCTKPLRVSHMAQLEPGIVLVFISLPCRLSMTPRL